MASIAELDTLLGQRLAAQNTQLHNAIIAEVAKVDDIVRKRHNLQNTALHNMVRRELAMALAANGVDVDGLAERVAGLLEDDLIDAVVQAVSAHPAADREQIKAEVREDIANRLTQEA